MIRFFERKKLVKKGLACNKTRRRQNQSDWLNSLECGWLTKLLILLAFLAGVAGLIYSSGDPEPLKGILISGLILITAATHLWIANPRAIASNSRLLLIFGIILLHLLLLRIPLELSEAGILSGEYATLILPFAFAPLVLGVLLGRTFGTFAAVFASLFGSVVLPDAGPVFLVVSLICGFVAVFLTLQVRRRSRLIRAGVFIGIATWVLAITFGLIGPVNLLAPGDVAWRTIGIQSLLAFGSGILTAMVVGGMLPMLESLFGITTDISWLEHADLNHPLLRRMTIEAPGTYHHSLVVANLAESAAEEVGANASMCRVCSYFHDIGKLVKPGYFTENMNLDRNPHDDLAPTMSALIIIAHVKEGVDLALKHKLNQQIIDVIQQHHGTSMVGYFYKRALQQQKDAKVGGKIMNLREEDIPEVSKESFRYPGPKPMTREAAIVSLADSVESASRSLEKPSPQKLEQLINDIFNARLMDGQLDECDLTMRELRVIASKFLFTLRSMMHSRIAYPKEEEEGEEEGGEKSGDRSVPPVSAA